jgi:hypothetical protein
LLLLQRSYSGVTRRLWLLVFLLAVPAAAAAGAPATEPESCDIRVEDFRNTRPAKKGELDLEVAYSAVTSAKGPRVQWVLTLRNRTRKARFLTFPTSQYANVVVRQGGRIRHSWHFGHAFFQAFTARSIRPRQTYVCTLRPAPLDLEPGRYEVVAYLTSTVRVSTRRSLLVRG